MRQIKILRENKYQQAIATKFKLNATRNTFIVGMVLFFGILQACTDINEIQQPYYDQGEHVYAKQVDSVGVGTGDLRISLKMHINSDDIKTARIYWNNGTDSVDVDVNGQRGVIEKIIGGLEEQQYIFQFVTINKSGQKSLPVEIEGNVYGNDYRSNVLTRNLGMIQALSNTSADVVVNWADKIVDRLGFTELTYKTASGELVTVKTPFSESKTILPNFGNDGFSYRTANVPDSLSIDAFYNPKTLTWKENIALDNSKFSIKDFSSQHSDGSEAAKNILDGNTRTRWHTQAWAGLTYPHWVTIDLGDEISFTTVSVNRTNFDGDDNGGDPRAPFTFRLEGSADNVNWTDYGVFDFTHQHDNDLQFYTIQANNIRYFKFTGLTGPDNNLVMGDILLYK